MKICKKLLSLFLVLQVLFGNFPAISPIRIQEISAATEVSTDENVETTGETVNIAMCMDENYVLPSIVAMTSILENKNTETVIHFYLLLKKDVSEGSKQKIVSLENKYSNCKINLIKMQQEFDHAKTIRHLTSAAYYRLKLPSLLPDLDKILYLDSDIVVLSDLKDLYSTNISDYYVAGAKEFFVAVHLGDEYVKQIGIPSCNQYICSAVLLMNLRKIREDLIERKFNEFIVKYHNPENRIGIHHDQDVINSVCYGKIYLLPIKYIGDNVFRRFEYMKPQYALALQEKWRKLGICTQKDVYNALKNPALIHYGSMSKPWIYSKALNQKQWWTYAEKTDYFKEIQDKYLPLSTKIPDPSPEIQDAVKKFEPFIKKKLQDKSAEKKT